MDWLSGLSSYYLWTLLFVSTQRGPEVAKNTPLRSPGISEILERSFGLVPKFWSTIGPINMLSVQEAKSWPTFGLSKICGARLVVCRTGVL